MIHKYWSSMTVITADSVLSSRRTHFDNVHEPATATVPCSLVRCLVGLITHSSYSNIVHAIEVILPSINDRTNFVAIIIWDGIPDFLVCQP